jgi:predicted metal-binding protein
MKKIVSIFKKNGFDDYAWIDPKRIVVSQWVRLKCMFGYEEYGCATCPSR